MNEHLTCSTCGHQNPTGALFCQRCNNPVESSPEDSMRTQAITGIDELLRQDRRFSPPPEEAAPAPEATEALDLSDLMGSGAMGEPAPERTQAIDFSELMSVEDDEDEEDDEEGEGGHDPTQAMDFRAFEAALSAGKKPDPAPPSHDEADGHDPTAAMDFGAFEASLKNNGGGGGDFSSEVDDHDPTAAIDPNLFKAAFAPRAPEPEPEPDSEDPEADPNDATAAISYGDFERAMAPRAEPEPTPPRREPEPTPPRRAPEPTPPPAARVSAPEPPIPSNLAPPPSAPPIAPPPGGGGRGGANFGGAMPEPEKKKTGLIIGIAAAALVLFCCCPMSIGGYFYTTDPSIFGAGAGPEDKGGEADEANEGDDEGGEGGDLSADGLKAAIEGEGWELIGEPTESNAGGIKVVAIAIKKDAQVGSVSVSNYGDAQIANQSKAAGELVPDTAVDNKGDAVVIVTISQDKEAAAALLKAILK